MRHRPARERPSAHSPTERRVSSAASFAVSILGTVALAVFLWGPTLGLYGSALLDVARRDPGRLREMLPLAPVPRALFSASLQLAALSALFAVLFGVPCGVAMARGSRLWRGLFTTLCALPLALPPMVLASAWLELVHQPPARAMGAFAQTQPSVVPPVVASALVLALCYYPLVAFAVRAALASLPRAAEDAAQTLGSEWQTWFRVRGPWCARAVLGAAALIAALALWEMGAPDLLDCRTYSVQIYRDLNAADALDPAGKAVKAALVACPLFALSAVLLIPVARTLSSLRYGAYRAGNEAPATERSAGAAPFLVLAVPILIASPLAPLFVFARQAQPLTVFRTVWEANASELGNTLWFAPVAALAITAIAFSFVAAWRNGSSRARRAALSVCVAALGIAPVMLGIALIQTLNTESPWGVPFAAFYGGLDPSGNVARDAFWDEVARVSPVLIGYAARFIPLALLLAHEAASRLDESWFEAAQNLGADNRRTTRTLFWPLLRHPLAGVFAVITALCAGELTTSVLVNAPGGQTATLPIFNQMHIGATAEVAALSLTVCALTGAAALAAIAFASRSHGSARPAGE